MMLTELIQIAAVNAVKSLQPGNILFGTVISINPLSVETDEKLTFTHEFLAVARELTDYTTVISFDDEDIKQRVKIYNRPEDEPYNKPSVPETEMRETTDIQFVWRDYRENDNNENEKPGRQPTRHTITVYNHLEVGERVILIKEEGGQRYFIIDREGVMEDGERCDTRKWSFY